MEGKRIFNLAPTPLDPSRKGPSVPKVILEEQEPLLTASSPSIQKKLQPSSSTMGMCLLDASTPKATALAKAASESIRQAVIEDLISAFVADRL